MDFDKIAKNWNKYTYPWVPSKEMKSFFLEGDTSFNKVLILWSTKEFRSYFKDKEIYISDISKEMIKKNTVWNMKEKVLYENWYNLKNWNYDLVLGDLVLLMFPFEKKITLIKNIRDNLSENWFFRLRVVIKKENLSAKNIIKIFKNIKNYDNLNCFFNYLSFELVNAFWMWWNDIYKVCNKFSEKVWFKYKESFLDITPYNGSENYCMNNKEFNIILEKFNWEIVYKKTMFFLDEYIIQLNS